MGLIISTSDRHFLHMNVLLRHASGRSGEAEQDIETILTEAADWQAPHLGEQHPVRRVEAVRLRRRAIRRAGRIHPLSPVDRDLRHARPQHDAARRPPAGRASGNGPRRCAVRTSRRASCRWSTRSSLLPPCGSRRRPASPTSNSSPSRILARNEDGRRRAGSRCCACRTTPTSCRSIRTCSQRCACRAPNPCSARAPAAAVRAGRLTVCLGLSRRTRPFERRVDRRARGWS